MSVFNINNLAISNFRRFEKYDIKFASNITVLFGKNGVGKTSLLHALHKACSFIFSNNSKHLGEQFLSAGVPGLGIQSFDYDDFYFNSESRTTSVSVSVSASATFNDEILNWELYKRSTANASLYTSKYEKAFVQFYRISELSGQLPVLAYFSDSFPHKDSKMTTNVSKQISRDEMPRNFGYFQWDFESACTSIWETRICDVLNQAISLEIQSSVASDNVNARKQKLIAERDFIQNALVDFSLTLPGDAFKVEAFYPANENGYWQLGLIFSDGTRNRLQKLPAGYRRLYSIVLDLAYRSFTLNKDIHSPGVVIIDEIDLHLHPELEQSVVRCLKEVFPSFQFILSTHSPLVLSNIDTFDGTNIIYAMSSYANKPAAIPNIYGIDYSATISDVMGVEPTLSEIDTLVDSYVYLRETGLNRQADNVYALLLDKVGNKNSLDNIISRNQSEVHR